jgi:hypothetical protein
LKSAVRISPDADIDFLDGVIEPKGYGFNLNSSMKFRERRLTSPWRVNCRYLETMKKVKAR